MLALLLALDGPAAPSPLGEAVRAYWAGEDATAQLEALHARRPGDDEVAYWLARDRYDEGRCAQALELLEGREGVGPMWRLRVVEGLAASCTGDEERAWTLLERWAPEMTPDPLRDEVWAVLGVLGARRGAADANTWLHRAGGDPARALGPSQKELASTPVFGVLSHGRGLLAVHYRGEPWTLDLDTGLAVPGAAPETECGVETDGATVRSGAQVLHRAPPKTAFHQLRCLDDEVWLLRRGPEGDVLLRGDQPVHSGNVASFDVGPRGLVLSVVVEAPQLWWLPVGGELTRLVDSELALVAPRWIEPPEERP